MSNKKHVKFCIKKCDFYIHVSFIADDAKLERFIFNCKNSIEKCKLILERYYTVRTSLPEFFAFRDPLSQDIQDSFNTV